VIEPDRFVAPQSQDRPARLPRGGPIGKGGIEPDRCVVVFDRAIDLALALVGKASVGESDLGCGIEPDRCVVVIDGAIVISLAQTNIASAITRRRTRV
jgi:hypothetical protein